MAAKKVDRKRRVKKDIRSGVTYIHSIFNNTIVIITDTHGNTLARSSAGSLGFKGNKRSTPFATQMAAEAATRVAMEYGLKTIDVIVRGPGSGREAAIRSLQTIGLEVTAVRNMTLAPYNEYRPPKHRRV